MSQKRFTTFEGVFTPSLLSILGVIMYLRLGWVVGQVGLTKSLVIIGCANLITLATALSMSSIVTNIRIGTGGAHSVIAKSLGVEVGGAIGIPLYISQAISVAFYITGFSECWISVFPYHNFLLVSLLAWFSILVVSYYSARLAFRVQYVIMALIGLSLLSIFLSTQTIHTPISAIQNIPRESFWTVFAIFFPAVTGVLAGASMSGELIEPQKSIPKGTLAAVIVSLVIYIALAVWFVFHASAPALIANPTILIDLGRWKWMVIAGIMGATISSAMSMAVGAPRILVALGRHSIIPMASSFARLNRKGEPTTAILLTALITLLTILLGTLNTVAGLLTLFFLITYGMINLSVFIEQSIGIASFRPSFRVPRIIPFLGGLGCLGVMLLINLPFTIMAMVVICIIYVFLIRQGIKFYSPDVRSGLLIFLAEKMTRAASRLPYHPKIWKPNMVIPVWNFDLLAKSIRLIESITAASGRLFFFKIISHDVTAMGLHERQASPQEVMESPKIKEKKRLRTIIQPLLDEGLLIETSVVLSDDVYAGSRDVIQAATDMFLPPNTLFYILEDDPSKDHYALGILREAISEGLGLVISKIYSQTGFNQEDNINLWIRRGSPNIDLSILVALQLQKNWDGHVKIIQIVDNKEQVEESEDYLQRLTVLMRLPSNIETKILVGQFKELLSQAPGADINIFGMPEIPDLKFIREMSAQLKTSVLFLRDSKHESAIA